MKKYTVELVWKFEAKHYIEIEAATEKAARNLVRQLNKEGEYGQERANIYQAGIEIKVQRH